MGSGPEEKLFGLLLKHREAKDLLVEFDPAPIWPQGPGVTRAPSISSPVTCPCVWLGKHSRAKEQGKGAVLGESRGVGPGLRVGGTRELLLREWPGLPLSRRLPASSHA